MALGDKARKVKGTRGDSPFIDLGDGDAVKIVFLPEGEEHVQMQHWREDGLEGYHPYEETCDVCGDPDYRHSVRVLVTVAVQNGITWEGRILAMSKGSNTKNVGWAGLVEPEIDSGKIFKWVYEYSRTGTRLNTTYRLNREEKLTDQDKKEIYSISPIDIVDACNYDRNDFPPSS